MTTLEWILTAAACVWVYGWLSFFTVGAIAGWWEGRHARRRAHRRRMLMQQPRWWEHPDWTD